MNAKIRVKPLEWEERHQFRMTTMMETYWRAQTAFDWGYRIKKAITGYAVHGINGAHNTLDEAKAAAQADYERRILSALEVNP